MPHQPAAPARSPLALWVGVLLRLGARLIEELRRADDAGDDQFVANSRIQNACPGRETAAIDRAIEELVVVHLDQVLMILDAGEDGGSNLGARGAAGEGAIPGRSAAAIDSATESVLVELIEPAIIAAAIAAAVKALIVFRRRCQGGRNL